MKYIIPIDQVAGKDEASVGRKAHALGLLMQNGISVPRGLCITTDVYEEYVKKTGIAERIAMELNRKEFVDMRWEELWDASLRIRNMFLNTPMPKEQRVKIIDALEVTFGDTGVAIRSSAPTGYATHLFYIGIYESYLNIRGVYSMLEHIRLVWASLWSDAALLYRQELGLDISEGSMAVLVQELIRAERSGVCFGRSPDDPKQAIIESIYGLNQGLLDGVIVPDRWVVDRYTGKIISHAPAKRERFIVLKDKGIAFDKLSSDKQETSPLSAEEVGMVFGVCRKAEDILGEAQVMEWTIYDGTLFALQSCKNIQKDYKGKDADRSWYRSLKRTYGNLKDLRTKIENDLVPAMIDAAEHLSKTDIVKLSDDELADEIISRTRVCRQWGKVYWKYFIPFAHGMRLFGRIYNDTVHPHDPYEFMDLLSTSDMISIRRNKLIEQMAFLVRSNPFLADALKDNRSYSEFAEFSALIDKYREFYGDPSYYRTHTRENRDVLENIILEIASMKQMKGVSPHLPVERLKDEYLSYFSDEKKAFASDILDLARASYRLRDDDSIYLGRIKALVISALAEGRRRLISRGLSLMPGVEDQEIINALKDSAYAPQDQSDREHVEEKSMFSFNARQLIGQPAGSGIVTGPARVCTQDVSPADVRAGEIIVCDTVDPDMTFILPIIAGIVETSGGMLIHGAIIAREYGIPCVTGITQAMDLIHTGDRITVDGYLGIVIIS